MNRHLFKYFFVCILIFGCSVNETIPTKTITEIETIQPIPTLTITPYHFLLSAVTQSPLEIENSLIELLKTNGNCKGKCLGGIYPDEMTVQDAVNVMSQWSMIDFRKNSKGETFVILEPTELLGQVNVDLSVGTWTKEMETIDKVSILIDSVAVSRDYITEDIWLANQDVFHGFQMKSLLETYGIPSYVGYSFSSILDPSPYPQKGERFSYEMNLHFTSMNMQIHFSGMAFYDGEIVFLCPSKEPHYLYITINPERPLKEQEGVYPVIWQKLTDTDLDNFYQTFTVENAFDVCVTTSLEKIYALQP